MIPEDRLQVSAANLRAANLGAWTDFLEALEGFSAARRDRVLTAGSTDQLLEFKGNARGVKHLTELLNQAHIMAPKILEKNRG